MTNIDFDTYMMIANLLTDDDDCDCDAIANTCGVTVDVVAKVFRAEFCDC